MVSREAVYGALFEKLHGVEGIRTFSRHLRHWDDVEPYEQPALFLSPASETVEPRSSEQTRYLMRANIYLYVHAPEAPSVRLNACLDSLLAVLNTPNPITGNPTLPLDGVVHCRAEGQIELDEGLFGEQAFALVPVSILCVDTV